MGTFEVFDSQGGWSFLFGKPLLCAFKAVHDHTMDKVTISDSNAATTLHSQYYANHTSQMSMYQLEMQSQMTTTVDHPLGSPNIFTRQTDPFVALWVEYITRNVQIGTDLTPGERDKVISLLTEFADVFACALSEVLPIPGAYVDLNIPEDATFHTTVHQQPMNVPQRQFMSKWIDQMHDADLIEPANIPCIKHVTPTVLTQKTHDSNESMTLDDLHRELNKQCKHTNLAQLFEEKIILPEAEEVAEALPSGPPKWRVTQNFVELNKATQVPPMFQGNIRAKQQQLSGHQCVVQSK